MTAAEYESVGWFALDADGDAIGCGSESDAQSASVMLGNAEPIELFRLRKPVPERPSVTLCTGDAATWHDGRYHVTGTSMRFGDVGTLAYQYRCSESALRALLDLPAATAKWEAEFGGGK